MKLFPVFAVLVVSGLLLAGCSGQDTFAREVEKEAGAVKLVREVERGDYGVITAAELKEKMDNGAKMLIVDTMPYEASYKKNHVPGAVQFLFPIPEMEVWDKEATGGATSQEYMELLGPDKERMIVVYCGFVKCTRSHNGAMWAEKLGYENVYRFPGGIHAWLGAGYPVESDG